jgi:hypothetical protein
LLVRLLDALGFDTHLSRRGGAGAWYDDANAGLEDSYSGTAAEQRPYVLKSPFLAQEIDAVLNDPAIAVDAFIVPVRDLAEAASSRVITELVHVNRTIPAIAELARSWEVWGQTPGGIVYSLNPIDQARLLAVDFYLVVQRIVAADVPIVLLEFPRFAQDPAYLHGRLESVLPRPVSIEDVGAALRAIVDHEKIRTGGEVTVAQASAEATTRTAVTHAELPAFETLDRAAVGRELQRTRMLLDETSHALSASKAAIEARTRQIEAVMDEKLLLQQ